MTAKLNQHAMEVMPAWTMDVRSWEIEYIFLIKKKFWPNKLKM